MESSSGNGGLGTDSASCGLVLKALQELVGVTEGLLPDRVRRDLIDARARVVGDRFNLAVLGEFKRGKSTLVNALLGRSVLPTGVLPLTAVATVVAAGPRDRLVVEFGSGRIEERPVGELADYVTEAGNPGNRLGVELVRLELDHELLSAGVELVDTPGIGSIHSHNTEAAYAFLPRIDAALGVLDAGQPLTEAERRLFADATRRIPRLLVVLNKIDHLEQCDRDAATEFVRSTLEGLVEQEGVEVFAVSARHGDGLIQLRTRLLALAVGEREALLVRSASAVGASVAGDAAQAARFEATAIRLPLDELESRAREFDRRVVDLQAASVEAGDLLEQGSARTVRQLVNEPLQAYARSRESELRAALARRAEEFREVSARELGEDLDRWVEDTIHAMFAELVPRFEASVAEELSALQTRYAARVGAILEQVQAVAEDVFGTSAGERMPGSGLRAPSRFSFKLQDPENALDMIVGFGRTLVPGALGRRLVVRDAEQRLIDMTDRHAGRLRSELAERVAKTTGEYRRELETAVDEAAAAIRAAIDRAHEDCSRGEQRAASRLRALAEIEQRCDALGKALTGAA